MTNVAPNLPNVDDTLQQMVDQRLPNFFRLYLNPAVAQACLCLSHLASGGDDPMETSNDGYEIFLANGHDEALSGALKLARFVQNQNGHSPRTLLRGERERVSHIASTKDRNGNVIAFLPDVETQYSDPTSESADPMRDSDDPANRFGIVIDLDGNQGSSSKSEDQIRIGLRRPEDVTGGVRGSLEVSGPNQLFDITLFDDSWVGGQLPFAAFAAKSSLFRHWRHRSMSTFHSTTFQPNTITALHFVRCLQTLAPRIYADLRSQLESIDRDTAVCENVFRSLYSPSLYRLIRVTGFDNVSPKTAGHAIDAGRPIIDCVAGVACSVRGHNPNSYVDEVRAIDDSDVSTSLAGEFDRLIGLPNYVVSGSGAAAVEMGLKIGLATQPSRDYVLALRGGFAGKTLFAVAATDSDKLHRGIDPLYPKVIFFDPHQPNCLEALNKTLDEYPIGIVQTELVQAVGGVRPIPPSVLELITQRRETDGYWLLVDEVQTGMYRTGQVTLSKQLGITPDIMTLGKGTSDMMVPSALTLYSQAVADRLREHGQPMVDAIARRHANPWGLKTILNTLRFCERTQISRDVHASGALFERLLREKLASIPTVREVRSFGLLIGIELQFPKPIARIRSAVASFYLLAMLRHAKSPVLAGFCQNDRSVLKVTPPLTITATEIETVCETIAETLRLPPTRVALSGLRAKVRSSFPRRRVQATTQASGNGAVLGESTVPATRSSETDSSHSGLVTQPNLETRSQSGSTSESETADQL